MRERLVDDEGEVRVLCVAVIAGFRIFGEVDPGLWGAVAVFSGPGRPPADSPKMRIGLRLAPDVVHGIRATGRGYNTRVEKVLREALAEGKL